MYFLKPIIIEIDVSNWTLFCSIASPITSLRLPTCYIVMRTHNKTYEIA